RREAYMLKQLQSMYAWRGSLVDSVIHKLIVPKIRSKSLPSEDEVIDFSMKLMDKQLEFGKASKHRCPNVTKSKRNDEYCAFYEVEYNGGISEEALHEARQDVLTALRNLIHSDFLRKIMTNSTYVAAQRSLVFQFENTTISCTPDLLTFFNNAPPLIVDWKVHSFSNAESWLQLGVYAVALSRIEPHKDFPDGIKNQLNDPINIRLVEYQLLKNKQREYSLSREDIADIYDYIFTSCTEINKLVNGKKHDSLDINQFQTARSPKTCETCQFKKLCWAKTPVQRLLFEVCWA
ncbi:MAG: PD-(D/E)XK nuclease family protein, partial [Candidatus Bathyarchaeia archaeon]